jgi:hypothetical protein
MAYDRIASALLSSSACQRRTEDDNEDDLVSRAELRDLTRLVDVDRLRDLLAPTTRRQERTSRSYAGTIAGSRGFPPPLIDHPRLRLWLLRDVEPWLDQHSTSTGPGSGSWSAAHVATAVTGPAPDEDDRGSKQ